MLIVSIHWTILSNFHFLHHLQILNNLIAITKYRNMHTCLHALHVRASRYCSPFFLGASLIPPWQFYQVLKRSDLIYLKYEGLFSALSCMPISMHCACMCTCINIINQLRIPILKYTERFVKICHLAQMLRCHRHLKFIEDSHVLFGYLSIIIPNS